MNLINDCLIWVKSSVAEYDGNIISADGDVNKYLADYTFDITKPTMIVGKAKISTEKDGKNTNDPLVELMKQIFFWNSLAFSMI